MNHSFETNWSRVIFYKYHFMLEFSGCNEVKRVNERELLLQVRKTGFLFVLRSEMWQKNRSHPVFSPLSSGLCVCLAGVEILAFAANSGAHTTLVLDMISPYMGRYSL